MIKRLVIILCLSLALCSCGCYKNCPYRNVDIQKKDSVYVKDTTFIRDSIIRYVIQEGSSSAILPQSDTSHLETDVAESDAWIDNEGRIHHSIRNKAGTIIPINVTIPYHAHAEYRSEGLAVTKTVEVEKPLSKLQSFFIIAGIAASCLFILFILFFIVKKLIIKE